LAQNPYNLVNSGDVNPIRSVRNSLEKDKQGRLTFVQNGNEIWEVYKDPKSDAIDPNVSNGIRKTKLLYIILLEKEYVD